MVQKVPDSMLVSGGAGATDVAAAIHAAATKTTPIDADEVGVVDSAASFGLKRTTWANVKATLKTYFDTLYQAAGSYLTAGGALGTPSSGTLTNATGLPPAGVVGTAAILGANTFTGAQVHSDQAVSRAMFTDCGLVFLDKGNSGTATQTLDYTAGSHQKITATGNHTIATSNWPPTGNMGELLLELTNGGAFTITWPTINWRKPDGTFTTSISTYLAANTGRTALQSSGTDFIVLWTRDAGTTIYGTLV